MNKIVNCSLTEQKLILDHRVEKGIISEDLYKAAVEDLGIIKAEGSRGGKVVGHTAAGKAIYKTGDKIMFHSHTAIRNSKDKKGTGYAKEKGEITHSYPDGSHDVMDEKDFITKFHPEKNNFEHQKSK